MKKFKKKIDKSIKIIESCWDENNVDDGLTFDERLELAIYHEKDETIKNILKTSKNW